MNTINRILELVNESGLTAKEFAENANIAGGSITDWKTSRSKPSVESLQKIAKYTGVQLEWLTGDSNFKTKQEEIDSFLKNKNSILILKTIQRYYYEFVVPCKLKEKDINMLVSILSYIKEVNQTKKEIDNYLLSFKDEKRRKKIKKLIDIIIKEIIDSLDEKDTYHYLISQLNNQVSINDKLFNIPVLGKIAAGQPILAEQYIEGYLPIDPGIYGMKTPDDYFYLLVSGESMNLKIHNGDYALIHKQDYAKDGDIVVAIINGDDEATLKKYKRINDDTVALEPMSTFPMEPIYINLRKTNFKIIGKAIGHFGKF